MSEWKEYKLGDIADIQNGYAFKSSEFSEKGIPIIKIKNIVPPTIVLDEVQFYNNEITQKLTKFLVKKKDFLISMTGSTVNQMASAVGKMARYQHKFPSLINQRVAKIFSTSNVVTDDYLFYYLNRYEVQYDLALSASGSANQANISPEQLKSYKVSIPDLPTQTAIAEILSSIDDKIELNNKINQELDNLAQTLFKHWFIDFEFPNENGEPYKSSGGEMVESELGEIPKGWKVYKFKEIVSKYIDNRGKTPPIIKDGIPLVEVKHMVDIGIFPSLKTDKFLSDEVYDSFLRAHLQEGDILMSTVGTIGRLNIVPNFQRFAIAQNVLGIRFKKDLITQLFMFCLMRTKGFNDEIKSRLIETVQSSIKRGDLEKIPVLIPHSILVENFENTIENLFNQIKTNTLETIELIKLRDTLLPKLISGELEINETNN